MLILRSIILPTIIYNLILIYFKIEKLKSVHRKGESKMKQIIFFIIFAISFSMQDTYTSDIWVEPITKMDFVKIDGGCFMMGRNTG